VSQNLLYFFIHKYFRAVDIISDLDTFSRGLFSKQKKKLSKDFLFPLCCISFFSDAGHGERERRREGEGGGGREAGRLKRRRRRESRVERWGNEGRGGEKKGRKVTEREMDGEKRGWGKEGQQNYHWPTYNICFPL
jgi:hypothetical protein